MNGILITWPQLLYLGLVLILFYVAELLLFLRRANAPKSVSRQLINQLETAQADITGLRQELELLKVRLAAAQAQQSYLLPHPEKVPSGASESNAETPYAHAIRMARQGADAAAVAQECGISRGEADLIVALYRTEGHR
ncbi:DUF2802 domain-containing protein [Amantichitinum ursilacus]|uniref:DUF2802 domain-containing protein n=1 Tax=Amantichitinum ursilacus TaxID=857265 RepID=A0A0N0GNH1_9NEIS|nr:DUF2802 domain-containing protein [Amantichitinum ursilacus]KPC52705.1 hypothetical protein WG78_12695 [Amantichitinum ursilacus]